MTCAKTKVVCKIETSEGLKVTGENWCRTPQIVCPRLEGEGYMKCRDVCSQVGHAEIDALNKLKETGYDPSKYIVATIYGHYHCCQHCAKELQKAGVKEIRIIVRPL